MAQQNRLEPASPSWTRPGSKQGGSNILEGAQHLDMNGAQITAVGGNQIFQNYSATTDDPMKKLHRYCAIEATHDSETVATYIPRCKPGTRQEVLRDLMDWAQNNSGTSLGSLLILWLSGPAGGGKSCIQRELVERCKEHGILAASYFFSSRVHGLHDSQLFVSTIAFQLCASFPEVEPFVEEAIRSDPALFDKSLEYRFEHLIGRPFQLMAQAQAKPKPRRAEHEATCWSIVRQWIPSFRRREPRWDLTKLDIIRQEAPSPHVPTKVVIIDGLDECRNPQERVRIIRLLASALLRYRLPFRVAIASRPEYEIRSTFDESNVDAIVRRLRLETYGCDTDIKDYLIDSLFDLRNRHPSRSSIPSDWPPPDGINKLVERASGQFIYASTFLKFIDNPRRHPVERFNFALNFHTSPPTSSQVNPFSDLDFLYTIILESTDQDVEIPLMKTILHGLVMLGNRFSRTLELDDFFRLEPGTSDTILCDMHSILHVPLIADYRNDSIRFYHRSLEDYLLSPSRSGRFHQPLGETYAQMLGLCADHLDPENSHQSSRGWNPLMNGLPNVMPQRWLLSLDWIGHMRHLLSHSSDTFRDLLRSKPSISRLVHGELKVRFWFPYALGDARNRFKTDIQGLVQPELHSRVCSTSDNNYKCIPLCHTLSRAIQACDKWSEWVAQNYTPVSVSPQQARVLYIQEALETSVDEWQHSYTGDGISHLKTLVVHEADKAESNPINEILNLYD
ncbi:hypothetical protein FA15DRAFT_692792 [Coprinopsis marcescibilis]|uniref:Nephrocystin 3-like N-terminal domain-containing protein n=1 Tax=Coprinopsis marcescibilis TaxID=230819 RepID=A0A5C3L2I8_COPMA|nr:hypothetical protein FA15DRAFT_692792 [Coprinopsis marcescibilis]